MKHDPENPKLAAPAIEPGLPDHPVAEAAAKAGASVTALYNFANRRAGRAIARDAARMPRLRPRQSRQLGTPMVSGNIGTFRSIVPPRRAGRCGRIR